MVSMSYIDDEKRSQVWLAISKQDLDWLRSHKDDVSLTNLNKPNQTNWRAIEIAAMHGSTELTRWILFESNQNIDCRGCDTWQFFGIHFPKWNDDIVELVSSIRDLQTLIGMDAWQEAYAQKNKQSRSRSL